MSEITIVVCEGCKRRSDNMMPGWISLNATVNNGISFSWVKSNGNSEVEAFYSSLHFCSVGCLDAFFEKKIGGAKP